ncbi:unnamed protein product, partial [Allacma fusca]
QVIAAVVEVCCKHGFGKRRQ